VRIWCGVVVRRGPAVAARVKVNSVGGSRRGAAFANLAALPLVPVEWGACGSVPSWKRTSVPAREPGQDGRGVGGGVDRPEQEVHTDPRASGAG
jgi:hypothetical protein